MPLGQKSHNSDAEFFPVQQIWRPVPGSVTGTVELDRVVKECLPGLPTLRLPFVFHRYLVRIYLEALHFWLLLKNCTQ